MGGEDVKVIVRSPFAEMKASPWEIEDAIHEDIPIIDNHVPKSFVSENGKISGMMFEKVKAVYEEGRRKLVPTGEADVFYPADDIIIAIGQENSFDWIERDLGIEFNQWNLPKVDAVTFGSSLPKVFFGGDAALGPKNIITSVAQGHQAAISIDMFCNGEDIHQRPAPETKLFSTKMGIHEWSYDNAVTTDLRFAVPHAPKQKTLQSLHMEVELGFDLEIAFKEAQRCLNCDVQTVFTEDKCIECDACMDVCPTNCITFTTNEEDDHELRMKLLVPAINTDQDILVSATLKTGKVMVKDEDMCLHCGLCAERCPTAAWDMQEFLYKTSKAGNFSFL